MTLTQKGRGSRTSRIIIGGSLLLVILVAIPAWGHKVKTNNQVGAIIHFEPSDQPKSQQPTQVWFALTKQGGKAIPLSDCDCQLQIYQLPNKTKVTVSQLQAINAEKYQDIPSAAVVFPQTGTYVLELSGKPVKPNDFKAFRLEFLTTVLAGVAASPTPITTISSSVAANSQSQLSYWAIGLTSLGAISTFLWWQLRRK
jgi:hypothetical protein